MSLLDLLMSSLLPKGPPVPTLAQMTSGALPGKTPAQEDFLLQQLRQQSDAKSLEALFQKYK